MFNSSESASKSFKMIRFFRIVGVLGGLVLLARILLFIAIIGGIIYILL